MATYSYLKRTKGIITLDFELDSELYRVGSTWSDYNNGYWVALTQEHLDFRAANTGCTFQEMLNLEMNKVPEIVPPAEPTEEELLEKERARKLREITSYDTSENVNSFVLNGNNVWLDKATRISLIKTVEIEKAAGREYTTLWLKDVSYTLPVDLCIQLLYQLELYALDCYNKTSEHKVTVKRLTTREEVENYDYTVGYPEKIIVEI